MKEYCQAGQVTFDNIIRRMRFAGWIKKATVTHSEYVILIAVELHQWSDEGSSVLCNTYVVCAVILY